MAEPAGGPRWADLGIRTLSAAVLIPVALVDVWLGGVWFELAIALLAVLMAHEWTAMVHGGNAAQFAVHAGGALSGAILPIDAGLPASILAIGGFTLLSAAVTWGRSLPHNLWTWSGVPYVAVPALALVMLRATPDHGLTVLLWLFAAVWAADTCAYFAGRLIGGPKLWPRVSPKKTWAGLGGAVLGASLAGWAVAAVSGASASWLIAAGALLGITEQGGDLFKSALKRHYGVKDSGRLIPGHGGVIDRVDGLAAAAVAALILGCIRAGPQAAGSGVLLW
jgi:phosphatidate cytidylyltransferase